MEQFEECWAELDDPRSGNAARHDFCEPLMIAFCTVLCGGQSEVDVVRFVRAKEPFLRGLSEAGERPAQSRHVQPVVPAAGSRAVGRMPSGAADAAAERGGLFFVPLVVRISQLNITAGSRP